MNMGTGQPQHLLITAGEIEHRLQNILPLQCGEPGESESSVRRNQGQRNQDGEIQRASEVVGNLLDHLRGASRNGTISSLVNVTASEESKCSYEAHFLGASRFAYRSTQGGENSGLLGND